MLLLLKSLAHGWPIKGDTRTHTPPEAKCRCFLTLTPQSWIQPCTNLLWKFLDVMGHDPSLVFLMTDCHQNNQFLSVCICTPAQCSLTTEWTPIREPQWKFLLWREERTLDDSFLFLWDGNIFKFYSLYRTSLYVPRSPWYWRVCPQWDWADAPTWI